MVLRSRRTGGTGRQWHDVYPLLSRGKKSLLKRIISIVLRPHLVLAEQEDAAIIKRLGVAVRQPQVRAPRTAQVLHIFDQTLEI